MGLEDGVPGSIWKIKGMLATDLFLTHYNPKKEIIVASDTRSYKIGTYIMHKLENGSINQ